MNNEATAVKLRIIPCSLRKANDFVAVYHRHSVRTSRNGGKFAVGAEAGGTVVGVAVVSNPLSATYMDGFTVEVLRACVLPDAPKNCNSLLYGACRRIWFEMGGSRIITYTLTEESGISLKGAGWTMESEIRGHDVKTWGKNDHLQRQEQAIYARPKRRWVAMNTHSTARPVEWPKDVNAAGMPA